MQIIIDCEASGPCPGHGELVSFAAVSLCGREWRSNTISPSIVLPEVPFNYEEQAYASFGYSRAQHLEDYAENRTTSLGETMCNFEEWLMKEPGKHTFWSDNPAFDWQWINKAFYDCGLSNPFGHSARRIGDLFAGAKGKWQDQRTWKKWRRTKHTHDPLDDARGNAEALRYILEKYFA